MPPAAGGTVGLANDVNHAKRRRVEQAAQRREAKLAAAREDDAKLAHRRAPARFFAGRAAVLDGLDGCLAA